MNPIHNHENNHIIVDINTQFEVNSFEFIIHELGNNHFIIKNEAINNIPADINSHIFKDFCGFHHFLILTKKVQIIDVIIPVHARHNGNNTAHSQLRFSLNSGIVINTAPRTIVAIIEPTKDSNKSAHIQATSPTLSPTLSAIVAGFNG
jgi:hypothetical protein